MVKGCRHASQPCPAHEVRATRCATEMHDAAALEMGFLIDGERAMGPTADGSGAAEDDEVGASDVARACHHTARQGCCLARVQRANFAVFHGRLLVVRCRKSTRGGPG
eukprot:TRINITY_DN13958_c0_g1_i1.p3 TRINITY_DN13958_c0_g1~~TRINITY_DN13958_c0_g1_i1.p3  ORF type:complete len:108 (+),score=7.61 TRINITY_DN13958_c0_g1_i1:204-527(+)